MADEKDVVPPAEGDQKPVEGQDKQPDQKPEDQKPADEKDQKPADKSADDKKDSEAKDDQGDKAKDIPETYDLKLPEGSPLKPESIQSVSEFAKANKLTNEQAQSVLERENSNAIEQVKLLDDMSKKWVEEVKADKELGGNNFTKTAELSKRVIEKYAPELIKELEATGLGNHPGFVKFVYRIGKAMDSGEFVKGGTPPAPVKSAAEVLYGGTSSAKE